MQCGWSVRIACTCELDIKIIKKASPRTENSNALEEAEMDTTL